MQTPSSLIKLVVIVVTAAFSGTNLRAAPPSALPPLKVVVADSTGKVAFKGVTDTNGLFSTGTLAAGTYVLQFNSSTAAKDRSYTLVISAGQKKVSAQSIDGRKLTAGGVAMKIAVAAGLTISGQLAAPNVKIDEKTKKLMVYIAPRIGSNIPGRWVPADSAEAIAAQNSGEFRTEDVRKWQDHFDRKLSLIHAGGE